MPRPEALNSPMVHTVWVQRMPLSAVLDQAFTLEHQEFIKIQGHRPCTEWNMLEARQTYFPKTGGVTNKPRLCPALAGSGAPEYCYLWGAKNPIRPGGVGFEAR